MMDFLELAGKRQSCRSYTSTPVEKEKILKILEAARLSPSACNSQPWKFLLSQTQKNALRLHWRSRRTA